MKRFWMIHGIGKSAPTYRHHSFDSAKGEAERLARQYPGTSFVILESVGACHKVDVEYIDMRSGADPYDDLPF